MNRECRNCKWADPPGCPSEAEERCRQKLNGPWTECRKHVTSVHPDGFYCCFEPHTEKERETTIPAGAAMVSVPWDWVERMEKIEKHLGLVGERHVGADGNPFDVTGIKRADEWLEDHHNSNVRNGCEVDEEIDRLQTARLEAAITITDTVGRIEKLEKLIDGLRLDLDRTRSRATALEMHAKGQLRTCDLPGGSWKRKR